MPPDHPEATQARPHVMTEIDLDSDQGNAEREGTAATDLQLESEQRAMQALHDHQVAAHAAAETLPKKELHCLRHSCTVTCPVNGQWRDCASLTSKSTASSGHSSGGEWQKEHSLALTLSQRRLTLPTLWTYTALVKHLPRP